VWGLAYCRLAPRNPLTRVRRNRHDLPVMFSIEGTGGVSNGPDERPAMKSERGHRPRKRRVRRIVGWSLLGLFGLILVVLALALVALANLDSAPMRGWIRGYLKDNFGMTVEYDELSVSVFSGLELSNLTVATPPPYAEHAPHLLSVGRLEASWDFWPLLGGRLRISSGELFGLKVCLVNDDRGGSSLQALLDGFGPPAPEEEPAEPTGVPLSHTLREMELPVTVEGFSLRGLELEQIELAGGAVARRITLESLGLDASVRPGEAGVALEVFFGTPEDQEGTRLAVEDRTGADPGVKEMVFRLKNAVSTPRADAVDLELSLDLVRQNLFARLPASGSLYGLQGKLRFAPGEGLTSFRIERLELGEGIASTELEAELRDGPRGSIVPRIKSLKGKLDAKRLLASVPLELGVRLGPTSLDYQVTGLEFEPVSGRVLGGSFEVRGRSESADFASGEGQEIRLEDVAWELSGGAGKGEDLDLESVLRIDALSLKSDGNRIGIRGLSFGLEGKKLRPDLTSPLESTGELGVRLDISGVRAGLPNGRATIKNVGLRLDGKLGGKEPVRIQCHLPMESLALESGRQLIELAGFELRLEDGRIDPRLTKFGARVELPVEKIRLRGPGMSASIRGLRIGLTAPGLEFDQDAPLHPRGSVALETGIGRLDARAAGLRVSGRRLGVEIVADLDPDSAPRLRGAIPVGMLALDGNKPGGQLLRIKEGRLGFKLRNLVLNERDPAASSARLDLDASLPAVSIMGDTSFSAPRLRMKLLSRGGGKTFEADLGLDLASFSTGGHRHDARLGVKLVAQADLRSPRLAIDMDVSGPKGPDIDLSLAGGFDKSRKTIDWNASVELKKLGVLGSLLPGRLRRQHRLDWKALRFTLKSQGSLAGVVDRFKGGTVPVLAADALEKASGSQRLRLGIHGLDYRSGDLIAGTPNLTLTFDSSQNGGPLRADLGMHTDRLSVQTDGDAIEVAGFSEKVSISSDGPLKSSRLNLEATTGIQSLTPALVAGYPVERASLSVKGHVDKLASVRVERIELVNPAGGTHLKMQVAMDRWLGMHMPAAAGAHIPGRRALTLTGSLVQDLDAIEVAGDTIRVGGKVSLPFRVESGDLKTFRLSTRLKAEGVSARMPADGLAIKGFDGDIPLIEDLALRPGGGVTILTGPPRNIYSRTRFLDTHPFLQGDNFLSVESLSVAGQTLGPIAGNLRINRDMFSLDQLQIGYRDGRISGQVIADYQAGKPRVLFKGNLTGIRPTQSEDVLDANATLIFVPDKLDLQGRIQVIRIGRQHLLDLLDFLDPYRENVSINRARLGLKVGYPKFLRLQMQDGFLALKISLGGAAKVVRIDEIRNIALGPFLNKYVAPYIR
jgi:hypothetical protein